MYFKIVCLLFLLCFTSHFLGHLMQYPVSSVECQTWLCKQWLHNFIPSWLGFGSLNLHLIFSFRLALIKIVHSTNCQRKIQYLWEDFRAFSVSLHRSSQNRWAFLSSLFIEHQHQYRHLVVHLRNNSAMKNTRSGRNLSKFYYYFLALHLHVTVLLSRVFPETKEI